MSRLGGDFMPAMDEGDPLSMPSALPGLSVSKASQRFQQTDRPIKSVPEVARVFDKAGRVDTAADPRESKHPCLPTVSKDGTRSLPAVRLRQCVTPAKQNPADKRVVTT